MSAPKSQAKAAPKAAAAAPAAAKPAAAAAPAAAKPAAKKAAAVEEKPAAGGLYDAYEGEPEGVQRKTQKPKAAAAAAASAEADAEANKPIAYQFTVENDSVGEKTNPQIKAQLQTAFFGWGVIDEIRVISKEESKEVTVFFSRPLGKALTTKAKLAQGEPATFAFAGKELPLAVHEGSSSGGGRASKTAANPPKKEGRGGRGGAAGGRGGRGGASSGSGCFNCGQEGHRSFECPTKEGGAGGDSRGGRGGARGGRGGRGGHSE